MKKQYSGGHDRSGPAGLISRTTDSLRSIASYAVLGTVAMTAASSGAFAQCTANGNPFVPFSSGASISSIVTTIGTINSASLGQSTSFVGTPSGAKPDEQGGGHWSRVIAGTVEVNANTTTNTSVLGIPTGTRECQTVTKQDYVGTQAGMDISRLNFAGGGNMHIGVTAGYFDIKSKDRTPGESTFSSETQVPFAGLYMMINSGAFSFDAQVRGDYYHMELNDPVNEGLFKQSLDAKGAAFLWNASYTFNFGNSWFLRPSVGGAWSRTDVDNLNVAGSLLVNAAISPAGVTIPGTVDIDQIESLTGRISLTTGGTITTSNLALQPFLTVSAFHEFAGNITARMTGNGAIAAQPPVNIVGIPDLNGTSSTSRLGTYGHVSLGVAGTVINTGWLGYIKGDYLFGDNIEALSVNAGLRYQFQPSPDGGSVKDGGSGHGHSGYNWTGFYAGTFTGGMTGQGTWEWPGFGETDPKFSGYLLGGTLGYNWQLGHLVLGVEADYGLANAEGGRECPGDPTNAFFFTCESDVRSLGTVTGRIGVAHKRALFFVKGGLAVGEVEARFQGNIPPGAGNGFAGFAIGPNISQTMTGWTLGGGMEFAITDRWSAKAEYMHFDLGKERFEVLAGFPTDVHVKGDTVRIGVNYHFGRHDKHYEPLK